MHILLVSSSSGSRGGGEHYLQLLASGLLDAGQRVSMLVNNHPRMDAFVEELDPRIELHRKSFPNTYDRRLRSISSSLSLSLPSHVKGWIRMIDPDLVHLNKQNLEDAHDLLTGIAHSGRPALTTIHVTRSSESLGQAGAKIRDWVARRALQKFSGTFITVSDACAAQLARFVGSRESIRFVANGIADSIKSSSLEGSPENHPLKLVAAARMEIQKDPLFLVERVLPKLSQPVHLCWIGDGTLRQPTQEAVEQLGLSGKVSLVGWHDDVRRALLEYDAFVLPSRYEGFPFSILEAMAAGLPCIVSDVDGNAEAVVDGETGRVLPAGDDKAWISAIDELASNRSMALSMGKNGRMRFENEYTVERMTQRTLDVYTDVIKGV